jgi:hypothetical protein
MGDHGEGEFILTFPTLLLPPSLSSNVTQLAYHPSPKYELEVIRYSAMILYVAMQGLSAGLFCSAYPVLCCQPPFETNKMRWTDAATRNMSITQSVGLIITYSKSVPGNPIYIEPISCYMYLWFFWCAE